MKRIFNHITGSAVVLMLAFSACMKDDAPTGTDENASVQLTLKLPGTGSGTYTRSITPTPGEENQIDAIDVLAFVDYGSGYVYDYTATNINKTTTPGSNDITVTATVKAMSQPQKFAILANSSVELAAAGIIRGMSLATVDSKIVSTTGGGEWPAKINGSSTFTPFPMYAITDPNTVSATSNTPIGPYNMLRMVARIDVALKASISNFALEEACLFNYKTAGYVSYGNSPTSATPNFHVTAPAVPTSGNHSGNPIKAPVNMYAADTNGEIKCSIYPFESEAITTDAEKITKTALVIGGYYNGASSLSYYRIDLKDDADLTSGYISSGILRNHLYKVEVQSVNSNGYPSPEDAYVGSSQLTAKIATWDLADQSILINGQFYLKVEPDGDGVFHKSVLGDTKTTILAQTNYNITSQGFAAGIYINDEIIYTPPVGLSNRWLQLTNVTGSNGSLDRKFILEIDRTKVPSTTQPHVATVWVKAGNLSKAINIKYIND